MDVIVMAMSTLPRLNDDGTIPKNMMLLDKKTEQGNDRAVYYSQMEPASRTILGGTAKDKDVRFIILGTAATKDPKPFIYNPEDPKEGEVTGAIKISAIDFFLQRMELKKDDERVKIIDIDENNPTPAIEESINCIRDIWDNYDNCKLWIDSQGGFRNIVLVINAIISLLKEDGIEPEAVYSINYGESKEYQTVLNQKDTYKIFQFVSGINEFRRYGRAEQLEEYYRNINERVPEEITQMKDIAEAIQMCNVEQFDAALADFRKLASEEKERAGFLNIFWQQIKEDYKDLLTEHYTGLDVVEWLYKKKFYQQAITYLEAKLPKEWIKIELEPDDNGIRPKQPEYTGYRLLTCKIKEKTLNDKKLKHLDPENRILLVAGNAITHEESIVKFKKKVSYEDLEELDKGLSKKYELRLSEDAKSHVFYYIHGKESEIAEGLGGGSEPGVFIPKDKLWEKAFELIINSSNPEKIKYTKYLLLLYKLLRIERNKFNHMSSSKERADQELLGKVIKLFIEVGRSVAQKCEE